MAQRSARMMTVAAISGVALVCGSAVVAVSGSSASDDVVQVTALDDNPTPPPFPPAPTFPGSTPTETGPRGMFTDATYQQVVIEESMKRPVVLEWGAKYCGGCATMKPLLDKISKEEGTWTFVYGDTSEAPEVKKTYNLVGVPTAVLINKGQEVDRLVGMGNEKSLRQWLKKAFAKLPANNPKAL